MTYRNILVVQKKHPSVRPKTVIKIIAAILLAMAIFAGGFIFSWFVLEKPLNDDEFAFCESIAQNIYSNGQQFLTDVQQGVKVTINDTTITVSLDSYTRRGKVVAQLHDGKLVMERVVEITDAIITSIIIGLTVLFICIALFVIFFVPVTPNEFKS